MKQTSQYPHLKVYRPTLSAYPSDITGHYLTQKLLDLATITVSLAGLIAAVLFLCTMG